MGDFKTWFESSQTHRISSIAEAKSLSRSTGLDTVGIEFGVLKQALAQQLPISYESALPIVSLAPIGTSDKSKLLQMMGAFAQKLGVKPPETLEQAQVLKVRGPDFRNMTPPIIVQKIGGKVKVVDGVSRVMAAQLLHIDEIRAFVIG